MNSNDLSKYFHSILLPHHEFLQNFNSNILKENIQILFKAFVDFYKGITGFPQFKKKSDDQSVKFRKPTSISRKNLKDGKLNLTKNIKGINFRTSKRDKQFILNHSDDIQNITISKTKSGDFYASILFKTDDKIKELKESVKLITGFDLGVKNFVVGSDKSVYENLHFFKKEEKKLKRLQRELSRKQNGSKNREKARKRLAEKFEEITNKKNNYIHEITTKIVEENQFIVLENLNVAGMIRNHKLAKSIQEMNFGEFRKQIEYKAKLYNRTVLFIDRWFPSSKRCSCCGKKNKDLKLSDRMFICPHCGKIIDRDLNAAINILLEGIRIILGMWYPDVKFVDYPTMDEKIGVITDVLKSSDKLKQKELEEIVDLLSTFI